MNLFHPGCELSAGVGSVCVGLSRLDRSSCALPPVADVTVQRHDTLDVGSSGPTVKGVVSWVGLYHTAFSPVEK